MKKAVERLICIAEVVFAAAFPVLFLYFQNSNEADFSEITAVLLVFIGIGLALMVLFGLLARALSKGAVMATVFVLLLSNFRLLEGLLKQVLPNLKYWHTLTILLVVGLHIVGFIGLRVSRDFSAEIAKVLALVYGGMILFNFAVNIPQMLNRMEARRELAAGKEQTVQTARSDETLPNIYLLMFDEYSNFSQMEQYYGYENTALKDFLDENRFSVSYTSHNESVLSSTIQTNLVNLEYLVDDKDTESDKEKLRKNGRLFSLMREHGYEVKIYEDMDFYGGELPEGGSGGTQALTSSGETLTEIVIKNSAAYPFFIKDAITWLDGVNEIVDYMSAPDTPAQSNTFILVYIRLPHAPFVVDENGAAVPSSHQVDWVDDRYYLGQFKYTTKLIIQILQNLVTNDPDSLIMIQSDHGARAADTRGLFGVKFPFEVMNNPLNAVYFGGETVEIEGLSSVNTLRFLLNRVLNTEFDMLEVPQGSV